MWVYDNDTVSDTFIVDLTKDRDVADNLPCNFLSVRNDSSLIAFVYLDNRRVGAVQAYSSDPFIGKNFEVIMIKQPDGDSFAIGDLFLQVGKNEQMSSTPYNPSWDLMEENIDVYASGCNNRISLSSTYPADFIKNWLNFHASKIVQRRLSVQGSASLGTYEIIFSPDTIISGGVPINGEVLDTKHYKKIIKNREFDYSLSNATIQGWMFDFLIWLDPANLSNTFTLDTDPGNGKFAYDNNYSNTTDEMTGGGTATFPFEVSFPSTNINTLHMGFWQKIIAGGSCYVNIEGYYSGSWHTIGSPDITTSSSYILVSRNNTSLGLTGVTKIRIRLESSVSGTAYLKIYDLGIYA